MDKGLPIEPVQLVTGVPIQLDLHPLDYVEYDRADECIVDAVDQFLISKTCV
jgi:hypothetical protein